MNLYKSLILVSLTGVSLLNCASSSSADPRAEVRVARNVSMISWEEIDHLRMSGFDGAQKLLL